jgi:hypothetical protein
MPKLLGWYLQHCFCVSSFEGISSYRAFDDEACPNSSSFAVLDRSS